MGKVNNWKTFLKYLSCCYLSYVHYVTGHKPFKPKRSTPELKYELLMHIGIKLGTQHNFELKFNFKVYT